MIRWILVALLLLLPLSVNAEVLWQENYDGITERKTASISSVAAPQKIHGAQMDWLAWVEILTTDTYDGETHPTGEIAGPGRGGAGQCLRIWKRNGIWTDYHGYMNYELSEEEFNNHYKELFIRWYVKIPREWDANLGGSSTHKLNRLYIGTSAGSKAREWYMDVKGSTFKKGRFSFYNTAEGNVHYTEKTITELGVNDGQWHSLEWHVKLNSQTGVADGGFTFYIDGEEVKIRDYRIGGYPGTPVYGIWNMDMGAATNEYFTSALPPAIGNLSGGSWNFPTNGWYVFEFDDYVVSTSYIGPDDPPSGTATIRASGTVNWH